MHNRHEFFALLFAMAVAGAAVLERRDHGRDNDHIIEPESGDGRGRASWDGHPFSDNFTSANMSILATAVASAQPSPVAVPRTIVIPSSSPTSVPKIFASMDDHPETTDRHRDGDKNQGSHTSDDHPRNSELSISDTLVSAKATTELKPLSSDSSRNSFPPAQNTLASQNGALRDRTNNRIAAISIIGGLIMTFTVKLL